MIDRMPRKGEIIRFNSNGMYPQCDNRVYVVLGKFGNHTDILNIQEIGTNDHTQVIVKFSDGFNKFLHFECNPQQKIVTHPITGSKWTVF